MVNQMRLSWSANVQALLYGKLNTIELSQQRLRLSTSYVITFSEEVMCINRKSVHSVTPIAVCVVQCYDDS